MAKVISNTFSVTTVVDGQSPNVNMLLRTIFDNGLDFIREKWISTNWNYVTMDSSPDTQYIEGHQSIRITLPASQECMFGQSMLEPTSDPQVNVAKLKPDTWYTMSWYSFASHNYALYLYNYINGDRRNIYADNKVIVDGVEVTVADNGHNDVPVAGAWDGARHYVTFKTRAIEEGNNPISTEDLHIGWYMFYDSSDHANAFVFCMPKLEEGEFATSYMSNEDDLVGQRGKTGRFFYYGGDFDSSNSTDTFLVNDAQAPYFKTGNSYHVFNYDVNGSYTMAQMYAIQSSFNNAPWAVMTNDFKYLITEALFGSYAHLGASIINGDWMLSEYGKRNGAQSTEYQYFDAALPKGSTTLASNVTIQPDTTDTYTIYLSALPSPRKYKFSVSITLALGVDDDTTLVIGGVSNTVHNGSVVEYAPTTSQNVTVTVSSLYSVIYSIDVVLEDAFIPNYAVDMRTGKTYMMNADISGNVSATEVIAANADMITTVRAGVLKVESTKSASYGIFAINSLNEIVLQMFDRYGKLVVNLGGTPSTMVNGEWVNTKMKGLGYTEPSSRSMYVYTAYDYNCTTYYKLQLGKMVNANNTILYYLPNRTQTTDASIIAMDGKMFDSNRYYDSTHYIPDGWYIYPNNGIFMLRASEGQQQGGGRQIYVATVYHYVSGELKETKFKEIYDYSPQP